METQASSKKQLAIMAKLQVAVLDDYQGISKPHYDKLDHSKFEMTYLSDTLRPYAHPDTPESVQDELVRRLEPFSVICKIKHPKVNCS